MLQLQRASAGSGKTFTLARKYIGYLLSYQPERESKPHLCRTPGEILQSLRQILAITFTNMATTEMKERIVDKLSALSEATSATPAGRIDYLDDFKKEFGATAEEIAQTARMALGVVLNNFSDFNVSTIDSFFQSVLRTFAYETNLTDSYQVEMDADLLAQVGINKSLEDVNNASQAPVSFWIERLMDKGRESGAKWNVFARTVNNNKGLYTDFLNSAKRTENETYKKNKPELDKYFRDLENSGETFRNIYERLETENEKALKDAHSKMQEAADTYLEELAQAPEELKLKFKKNTSGHAEKMLASKYYGNKSNKKGDTKPENLFTYSKLENDLNARTVSISKSNKRKELMQEIDRVEDAAADMYQAWSDWCAEKETPRFLHWLAYRDTLLYFGLLQEIRRNVFEYLQDNGLLELSDTGIILRQIIDDSEVPFIYERLGSKLNHYLIDEFQDTSALQWENMSPLLTESVGRGEESLVIGDAKQSIYRFRNADSDIITTKLPDQFGENHRACGDSVAENTNWRSDRRIVEFNNYFFHTLASLAEDAAGNVGGAANVYSGVVQRPSHTKDRGLVSIKFVNNSSENNTDDDTTPLYFYNFGELVQEILKRGYRQRDIAFLVNKKAEGANIINTFVDFNSRLPEGAERIEFVSEESLYISSSKAVTTVIAALKAISEPRSVTMTEEKERHRKGLGSWENIGGHFHLYVMRNGGVPTTELLERFKTLLGTPDDPTTHLQNIVTGMQAHTLPALVEMAIGEFVSKEEAKIEAPYLAALQDLVLEYSERHSTDVASFLKWWESVGSRKSITSPKDIDAVKVMTIHKSKGLQFKCVIVPEVKFRLIPYNKSEWLWVKPDPSIALTSGDTIPLPDMVPVDSQTLINLNKEYPNPGVHHKTFSKYAHDFMMDILNKAYVAFTRAEEELHIYVPFSDTDSTRELIEAAQEGPKDEENSNPTETEKSFKKLNDALLDITLNIDKYLEKVDLDSEQRKYMPSEDVERVVSVMEHPNPENGEDTRESPGPVARTYRDTEIGRVEFGHPRTPEERAKDEEERLRKKAEEEKSGESAFTIRRGPALHAEAGYHSGSFPHSLHFRLPDTGILTEDEQEAAFTYVDPRSEGNIMHEVLEHMETARDLTAALQYMRVRGKVTESSIRKLQERLEKMLEKPTVASWFRPGLRVLAERPILEADKNGTHMHRPDRIVIDEEGQVIVIDYKTGKESKRHRSQVTDYVEMLRKLKDGKGTPLFQNVKGWLWYLEEDIIEEIC